MITLTLKEQPNVPLEAEMLSPDVMAGLTNDEIRALPVDLGKRQRRLDDFFSVEGEKSDELDIRGDVREGQLDWARHDPWPHHRRQQRWHAPRAPI